MKGYNTNGLKNKIAKELTYIGYDFSHNGTIYLIEILYTIYTNELTDCINLSHDIYPRLSRKYKKSISAIKSSINYATMLMYSQCDSKRLLQYFSFYNESKPSVKTVIYTVLNRL